MAGRRRIIAHMITWPDKLWMGITHSGIHTKGSLGWWSGGGGSNLGQTHLAASLAVILRGCWNPMEPSFFAEWALETIPAVWLLITLPHYRNHCFCSSSRHCFIVSWCRWVIICAEAWRRWCFAVSTSMSKRTQWHENSRCWQVFFYLVLSWVTQCQLSLSNQRPRNVFLYF